MSPTHDFTATGNFDPRLPLAATALGIVGLAAIPSVIATVKQTRQNAPKDNFYEDEDGKSTPEAVAEFSNKKPKAAISIFSVTSFGTYLAVAILSTLSARYGSSLPIWLTLAAFAVIVLQATFVVAQRSPVAAHDLGRWAFLSTVITTVIAILQLRDLLLQGIRQDDTVLIIRVVNLLCAVALAFSTVCLPRRPHVFFRDEKVDPQFTVSVFSRYTWSYVYPLIDYATKKGDLEEKDVPQPDHLLQVDYLLKAWHEAKFTSPLAWSLFSAYKARLFVQWGVIVVRCFFGIGPFYIMLRLIETLDYKIPGQWPTAKMWEYVFWMGFFSLGEMWLDGWIAFQSITMVSLPMRAQLSALVFEKSLRRKTVKSTEKSEDANPEDKKPEAAAAESNDPDGTATKDADKKDEKEKPEDDDTVLKSRQAIVNLVGVDVRRISNFFAFSFQIFLSIGKLIIYSAFLVKLIGWIPFAAGMFAWGLSLPVNTLFSKLYMKASDDLMKLRDRKLAVVNEALLGMRQIKFAALEAQWQTRIMSWRDKELAGLWKVFRYDIILIGCWIVSPILLAATSLATYAVVNGNLSPSVAFVSIGIFKALEVTLGALPELLTSALDTLVSIRRVEKYLGGPEIKKVVREGPDVAFENASIAWPVDEDVPDNERFILNNINLSFPAGELSVVSGKTGTGKSLLLSAILGEVDLLDGTIYAPPTAAPLERHDGKAHPGNWILPGSIAYVSQTPWLESASLRDNILFGLPLIEERYNTVIDVCALKKDLAILADGDKTELGANGINLSGGQKWRITLARAIYSRAEILVMDDIFSAVDAHVGRQIFEKCIGGEICQKRTRILVTHHVGLVQSKAKYIVELGEGTVTHAGLVSELAEDGTLEQIKSHEQQVEVQEALGESSTAVNSEDASIDDAEEINGLQKVQSKDGKKFIEDEKREKGMVKTHVYKVYFREAGGFFAWGVCLLCFFASEAGDLGRSWWLKIWTGDQDVNVQTTTLNAFDHQGYGHAYSLHQSWNSTTQVLMSTSGDNERSLAFYLWVYVAISVASAAIGVGRFYWSLTMSLKASRTLFEQITFAVLRTPLRWLDTVPVGRILNRMTSDFEIIDQRVAMNMGMMMWNALAMLGVCVAGALVSGFVLPLALLLMGVAVMIGKKYLDGARPLKRLESTAKSPVFELFNAALAGMPTLRAYQKTQVYVERMHKKFDTWDTISAYIWVMNRWLGIRMAILSALFTFLMGTIVIVSPGIGSALGGFALSFAVDFALNMIFAIRLYSQLELDMNGTERVVEYTELKTETQEGEQPPAAWPTSGRFEVEDLVVAYADDLPPVLRGISFDVKDNERIGVVGRTGAGKSSLTLALFRFLESRSGKVTIDGLDISKINLHSLRSRLAIIPQDPVLFSGTVRSNLDPFDDHSDEALKECLARVHLLDSVSPTPVNEPSSAAGSAAASTAAPKNTNIFKDLSSPIAESGGNLSQGQRQLLCLARAIISRPKIMVLDEATSAVDMSTDALIQRSIREEFTSSTLLVIAHRLSTIADFDRILVLSEGQVAEFGTPKELWEKEDGIFRDMCESSGEKEKLKATIFG